MISHHLVAIRDTRRGRRDGLTSFFHLHMVKHQLSPTQSNWFKLKEFLKNHYIHYQWEILVTKCLTDKEEKRIIAILERLQQRGRRDGAVER